MWTAVACAASLALATAAPTKSAPKAPVAKPAAAKPAEARPQETKPVDATPAEARPAVTPAVRALVERVQAFYEKTRDFTASFQQDYAYHGSKRTQRSTGTVRFKKPALMRWEYAAPSKKSFVLTGDTVYALDAEAQLLTIANLDTNQLSAAVTFLWGRGNLLVEFDIRVLDCSSCQGTLLELTHRAKDPRFRLLRMEVDPATAQVTRSIVVDPDGSENAITFKDLNPNAGVEDAAFKLQPPEGTQVQDFRKKGP
ncbi:MAG: outer membrane lipoprotein carrier protein LolA [Deltaproteobacteria bacterium]|nr:outer membrane lipoprotein carrier protein LolA [Deltaproteobacteria bacterium]